MSTGMSSDSGGGLGDMAWERRRKEWTRILQLEVLVVF